MHLRRAILIAACLLPGTVVTAAAQFPPQQQEEPACAQQFGVLRDDAAKKASAIQAASARKAPAAEACQLFNAFSAAEAKMLKYATDNQVWCGIPPQIIASIKQQHAKTAEIRARVCQAAAAPPRPAAPTLSDALTAPITNSGNIKSGGGTFDTLTGTPLGSK